MLQIFCNFTHIIINYIINIPFFISIEVSILTLLYLIFFLVEIDKSLEYIVYLFSGIIIIYSKWLYILFNHYNLSFTREFLIEKFSEDILIILFGLVYVIVSHASYIFLKKVNNSEKDESQLIEKVASMIVDHFDKKISHIEKNLNKTDKDLNQLGEKIIEFFESNVKENNNKKIYHNEDSDE
jgi:hypothetical protein